MVQFAPLCHGQTFAYPTNPWLFFVLKVYQKKRGGVPPLNCSENMRARTLTIAQSFDDYIITTGEILLEIVLEEALSLRFF